MNRSGLQLLTPFLTLTLAFSAASSHGLPRVLDRDNKAQSARSLTLEDRIRYQRAIEDVYWRHRIWPKENRGPKPALDELMPLSTLRAKVEGYLRESKAITGEQLQAEIERIARHTKRPAVLKELWAALENDPYVIAECLARQILAVTTIAGPSPGAPSARGSHTAVWTGGEMIVWGGYGGSYLNTGGRYDPATDTWTGTSTTNAPSPRGIHTAVWTGTEMIVWGGVSLESNIGGRYNPATDTWTATNATNAPDERRAHTAIWTGTEMIVWGGIPNGPGFFNTGGRYDPAADSWTATSTINAPSARGVHTAVWTGSEMIVWGGVGFSFPTPLNTGGRYDPSMDSWTATNTANAPGERVSHTAVWTDTEMVVWGGGACLGGMGCLWNSGARYDPSSDNWTAIRAGATERGGHTAVWTGSEMIVWGGFFCDPETGFCFALNTGGRYDGATDTWTDTSTTDAPSARSTHTAVWTDGEMIVWGGGADFPIYFNTGGRYDPANDTWTRTRSVGGNGR